jgi:hypothetical protein
MPESLASTVEIAAQAISGPHLAKAAMTRRIKVRLGGDLLSGS